MVLEWPSFSTCASDPGRGVPTTVLCPQCCGNGAAARRQVSVSTPIPLSQRSDMVVFLNGEFIPADQARVGVMTHALSYGTGCFEGIRAYWNESNKPFCVMSRREIEKYANHALSEQPGAAGLRYEFRPRSALGLYSDQSRVSFRNVVLSPLPEKN